MKIILTLFTGFFFAFVTLAQIENVPVAWTPIKMSIPSDSFIPRELFKINDTTLYLGCRYYLLKVSKDSLRIELENKDKQASGVIRSVLSFENVLYVSNENNSVLARSADSSWVNVLTDGAQGNLNWEMVVYKSELIYTSWPRWIAVYNFPARSWRASSMLDQQAAGFVSEFEKTMNDLYVSLYGGGVYKKDRKTDNWINCNKGLSANLNVRSIKAIEGKFIFSATEDGVYYSGLNKINWRPCKQTQRLGIKYVDLMYHNNVLYATGTNGELLISKDLGKTWKRFLIKDSRGYALYSIEAIGPDLYISADGQGKLPSAVFTIPIADVVR